MLSHLRRSHWHSRLRGFFESVSGCAFQTEKTGDPLDTRQNHPKRRAGQRSLREHSDNRGDSAAVSAEPAVLQAAVNSTGCFPKNCCTLCEISRESSGLLLPDGSETHSFPKSSMRACPDGNRRCSSLPHRSSRANRSAAATCWKKQVMETQVFSLERRRFSGISGYIFSKTC